MARRTFDHKKSGWLAAAALSAAFALSACGKFSVESSSLATSAPVATPDPLRLDVDGVPGRGSTGRDVPSDVSELFAQERKKSDKALIREAQKADRQIHQQITIAGIRTALQTVRLLNRTTGPLPWPPALVVAAATLDSGATGEIPSEAKLKELISRLGTQEQFQSLRAKRTAEITDESFAMQSHEFAKLFDATLQPTFLKLAAQLHVLDKSLDSVPKNSKGVTP